MYTVVMVIPAQHAQIAHHFGGDALPRGATVTYGVGFIGIPTPNSIAETCHALFALHFLPLMGSSVNMPETIARLGPSPDGPSGSFANPVSGGNSNNHVTPQVSVLIRKRTSSGGRRHRGRFYLPGLIESGVDPGGLLSGDTPAAFQDGADDFLAALATAALPMVILHFDATDPTTVISLDVDARVATQRRRLRG